MSTTSTGFIELSGMAALETLSVKARVRSWITLSLFWRTFFLLVSFLLCCILLWSQALRLLEVGPHAVQAGQQLAVLVNLTQVALQKTEATERASLIKTLAEREAAFIFVRLPTDTVVPLESDMAYQKIAVELRRRLGSATVVSYHVNQQNGLWVSFSVDNGHYWLRADASHFNHGEEQNWLVSLLIASLLSLMGAVLMTRLLNQPFKQLSFATSRVHEGDFGASTLDENVATSEIRDVNIGFNRMTQKLSKIEEDRIIMLAGISHDLRTPLARLRLETEMSVSDPEARADMVADMAQMDAIIGKFLDYARPDNVKLGPVSLREILETCLYTNRNSSDIEIRLDLKGDLFVLADAVELCRVLSNLVENARRYGKSAATGVALIEIMARTREQEVLIRMRDHGPGVPAEQLLKLTKPFYRGEAARTAANGAGLGLAIVEKTVAHMGGTFSLRNSSSGGLVANIKLQYALAS